MDKENIAILRQSIIDSLPDIEPGIDFPMGRVYVPPSHIKALQPENTIVEGMRGAGKSFWTATLSSENHRHFIKNTFPNTNIEAVTRVSVGFGTETKDNYPSRPILESLREMTSTESEFSDIWRTVIINQIRSDSLFPKQGGWKEKYQWVRTNPELVEILLRNYDADLSNKKKFHFILFDALDRSALNWYKIRPLAKSLFQIALEFQSYRAIRLKLFVRPDMLDDKEITAFPDASKLLARKVILDWRKVDLYALFFQSMVNAKGKSGKVFRNLLEETIGMECQVTEREGIYTLPNELRKDESMQQKLFERIAGKYMTMPSATAYKRGFPYTWLPNHLMDCNEKVSPRSFCTAIRVAAEEDIPEKWEYPLYFEGIQSGVQTASKMRVIEMKEDYPWVEDVLKPCQVLSVPIEKKEIVDLWQKIGIVDTLRKKEKQKKEQKLLPQNLDEDEEGLLKDLENLGMISRMTKERIQIPDVYRVAFGMGRKGGIPILNDHVAIISMDDIVFANG
ncbi:MAG: hypothetical protein LBQ50_00050 [Planctomycetaceae bacterium]|jgi:hypothetical protein|nr:hypothetical protein [Planctomycetaceae bacterium]